MVSYLSWYGCSLLFGSEPFDPAKRYDGLYNKMPHAKIEQTGCSDTEHVPCQAAEDSQSTEAASANRKKSSIKESIIKCSKISLFAKSIF